MGGVAAIGTGIQGLLQIMGEGGAANTLLEEAMLSQQFQQQEQNTVLQMGLAQEQNEQRQVNMIARNASTVLGLQQKTQQTLFKTAQKINEGWIQALGGKGG